MQIKKVKQSEFESLIELMNDSFNMEGNNRFEHLLPKYYFKENTSMIHYGVYENDILVASIGLYPMTFISNNVTLSAACVGAVSTHPSYRNKGYFSLLMKKIIERGKKNKYDLLFLGGNRYRYGHFNFECGGRKLVVNLSKRTKKQLRPSSYVVKELNIDDSKYIDECLKLYNNQRQHIIRTKQNFYSFLLSWNCKPYIVLVDNQLVGYFTIKGNNEIYEMMYKKGYRDTLLSACLLDKESVNVTLPMWELNNNLLNKVDWYVVEHNEMFYVYNWDNVAKYLRFNKDYEKEFTKLSRKEKIRFGLGDEVSNSHYSDDSFFIFPCDAG